MITIYIKPNQFFKNVNELGNIFEINYPTREIISENKESHIETYDWYVENGFTKVELDDKYKDCDYFDFNEDLTFSIEKYNARKQKENEVNYENKIMSLIRQKYSINQELAILRQRDTKPIEYQEYFDYVELCKQEAKNAINQK